MILSLLLFAAPALAQDTSCNGYDDDGNGIVDDGATCGCPMYWFEGHSYAICSDPGDQWDYADSDWHCTAAGYELVTIDSAAENAWLWGVLDGLAVAPYWIGLNDRSSEGNFEWLSGAPLGFENWGGGQPDNSGGEDCVALDSSELWDDQDCNLGRRHICEGCNPVDWWPDADQDGYGDSSGPSLWDCVPPPGTDYSRTGGDCDDSAAGANPAGVEIPCNGLDDDCDPGTPDAIDGDGDGFTCGADCDDGDSDVYQGAPPIIGDGIDQDCDGVDECFTDGDGDGYGSGLVVADDGDFQCVSPGESATADDCDDGAAGVNPGAVPTIADVADGVDRDCDGADECTADLDGDGVGDGIVPDDGDGICMALAGEGTIDGDCDDADPDNFPGNPEVCDFADNDCDTVIDNGVGPEDYWPDVDGDGFGDGSVPPTTQCGPPVDHVADDTDCDDADSANFPGNPEVCDDTDNDCDGVPDNGLDTTWFRDGDGDGVGTGTSVEGCDPPPGWVPLDGDCDDADAANFPGNPEVCDDADNDCDGAPDNGLVTTWYRDDDGDGVGTGAPLSACDPPPGWVPLDGDCDDADAANFPGNPEVCDDADNDCDGAPDNGLTVRWYLDGDGDGVGTGTEVVSCDPPQGYVDADGDCDDDDPARHPGRAEEPDDGIDQDCDGHDLNVWFGRAACGCAPVEAPRTWSAWSVVQRRR